MPRLPALTPDKLSAEQKELYDKIAGDKRRQAARSFKTLNPDGSLTGPFNALLYSPKVGDAVQELGAAIRFASSLPGHLRELAILMVAQRWRANYEWYAHAPIAAREGLDAAVIEAVKEGSALVDAPADVMTVHRFVSELVQDKRVQDETYEAAHALVGDQGLFELITLVGHYALLAGLLNTLQVGVPEGEELPFGA